MPRHAHLGLRRADTTEKSDVVLDGLTFCNLILNRADGAPEKIPVVMSGATALAEHRVDAIESFKERACARAYLWNVGELDLQEAVDALQEIAKRSGLIDCIGQDAIQSIIAEAFRPFWDDGNV